MTQLPFLKKLSFIFSTIALFSCGGSGGGGNNFNLPTQDVAIKIEKVVKDASYPVGLTFTPEGTLFYTELKSGNVKTLANGAASSKKFTKLDTSSVGAEGLLGIIADPDYSLNGYIYVYQAVDNPLRNRIVRLKNNNGGSSEQTIILDNIPASGHNGGKFVFGNDGSLFITTGDTGNPNLSQDLNSLAGKVLRINKDGSIPQDNPIAGSPVFALGIRNAFGISKYPASGSIYISENGPDCNDEVNKVSALSNFGWRIAQLCNDQDPSYVRPLINIDPVLGVTGLQFYSGAEFPEYEGRMLLADVNGGAIRRYVINDSNTEVLEEAFLYQGGSGGINDLAIAPDGKIYFSTQDGIFRIIRAS